MLSSYKRNPLCPVPLHQREIEHIYHLTHQKGRITRTKRNQIGYVKLRRISETESIEHTIDQIAGSLSYLKGKERELLALLLKWQTREFTPIDLSREIGVTNKTVISEEELVQVGDMNRLVQTHRCLHPDLDGLVDQQYQDHKNDRQTSFGDDVPPYAHLSFCWFSFDCTLNVA